MNPTRTKWAMLIPLAALGVAAASAALTATLVPAGGTVYSYDDSPDSLFDTSFWVGLQVLVLAVAAGAAAVVFLFGRRIGERTAGCLTGCGLALIAFFVGDARTFRGNASVGAYLGFGAGAALTLMGLVGFAIARRGAWAAVKPPRFG
jgi:hypothetical protein